MSAYLGDFIAGATVHGWFNTIDLDGAPITLAGTPALRVYKNADGTEDDSGITLDVDADSRTGAHRFTIDLSSDGTFYAAGGNYAVVITSGTVDGVSVVGRCVGQFSIANRSAYLTLTTAVADSVATTGSRPTPLQGILMLTRFLLTRRAFSGGTLTAYKEDGTTPSMTFTANSATAPGDYERD